MFAIIGALLSIVLMASALVGYYIHERHEQYNVQASVLGHQIADYMNAAEERMTVDSNLKPGTYAGVKWLKSAKCGGTADKNYLPCTFEIKSALLKKPISISITREAADKYKYSGVLTIGPVGISTDGSYQLRPDLAGGAILAAKTYFIRNANQFISASSSYALDKNSAVATINMMANQINGNVFVRRDGSVDMEADLKFDPSLDRSKRQLVNVSDIVLTGDEDTIKAAKSLGVSASGNVITQNAIGTYINDPQGGQGAQEKTIFLGNQSGVKRDSNLEINDARIKSMNNQYLSDLLQSNTPHQDNCYTMKAPVVQAAWAQTVSCRLGYYPVGFKIVQYYDHPSPSYLGVRCCKFGS